MSYAPSMTLSERLKAETRDAHDAIEAAFDLDRSLDTRESYVALLRRLHGIHAAFERAAAPHLTGTDLFAALARAPMLNADLEALGARPDPAGALVPADALPADRAEAVGSVYVLEGSTLGGLLIARTVERRLGFGPGTGARFFAGHGRDTMRNWQAVRAAIDALAGPDDERSVRAANRTFAAMGAVLAPDAPPASGPAAAVPLIAVAAGAASAA